MDEPVAICCNEFLMKLSAKHIFWEAFIGLGLLIGIFSTFPDGKLHIVFCTVGQGDGTYIRMPNQADLLIDGGPDNKIIGCLGRHMPFYDRTIDAVILTHPQKDHLDGLIYVLQRYHVNNFITIPLKNDTASYKLLVEEFRKAKIVPKYLTTGQELKFGSVVGRVLWPDKSWLASILHLNQSELSQVGSTKNQGQILGLATDQDLNLFCIYLYLKYGNLDALFTGDGDRSTQIAMQETGVWSLLPENLEILKVPHHGSKTGMLDEFVDRLRPKLSVIEVGKNHYGHPSQEAVNKLSKWGKILRTDQKGDVEVISDGKKWWVK